MLRLKSGEFRAEDYAILIDIFRSTVVSAVVVSISICGITIHRVLAVRLEILHLLRSFSMSGKIRRFISLHPSSER